MEGNYLVSDQLSEEWSAEHKKHAGIAGLFRGWAADGYGSRGLPRILYIGQATSGNFNETDVHSTAFDRGFVFWTFARKIVGQMNLGGDVSEFIAWSNISKLSGTGISADPKLIGGLTELASRTIEHEILAADPDVIVFVSGHFSNEVVNTTADATSDADWTKSEDESDDAVDDVWWRTRHDGRRVLWMCHPRAAHMAKQDYAAAKIAELGSTSHLNYQKARQPLSFSR